MRVAAALLCGAMLAVTLPAHAQRTTGTRIGPDPASINNDGEEEARRVVRAFGNCVVRTRLNRARALVAQSANDAGHVGQLRELVNQDCLSNGELRMPPLLMRGAVFEGMVNVYHGNFRPTDLSSTPPIDYRAIHNGEVTRFGGQVLGLNMVADCVFRRAPADSRALLDLNPGTGAERRAFEAVIPHLAPCINAGQTITFSRSVLRYALAEVVYRHAALAEQVRSGGGR